MEADLDGPLGQMERLCDLALRQIAVVPQREQLAVRRWKLAQHALNGNAIEHLVDARGAREALRPARLGLRALAAVPGARGPARRLVAGDRRQPGAGLGGRRARLAGPPRADQRLLREVLDGRPV